MLSLIPVVVARGAEVVLDIHQHTNYAGRTNEQLRAHQRTMGATKTILLPAGSKYGLAAGCGGNETVIALARAYPKEFLFFANELPDIPETKAVLEKVLKAGAIGIGEQKFHVECDSKPMQLVADIAKDHRVPVLMHFQHKVYNMGFERFHRMLEMYPTVNFIGHAQTWWANIDKKCDQSVLYPKGPVTPGGITDRLLSDYPNIYGDLSAGSGLNALLRDEDHARNFLKRHQDKLLYGSDCDDRAGAGKACSGSQQLATIRRLAPDAQAVRKMLYGNAAKLLKIA
ncbi:MAG TPA: amidohydrolase family protein [Bryobacteraceae bacterium]|nr:amidohydrolase family protein [Bryobacteraceae bacterium]